MRHASVGAGPRYCVEPVCLDIDTGGAENTPFDVYAPQIDFTGGIEAVVRSDLWRDRVRQACLPQNSAVGYIEGPDVVGHGAYDGHIVLLPVLLNDQLRHVKRLGVKARVVVEDKAV